MKIACALCLQAMTHRTIKAVGRRGHFTGKREPEGRQASGARSMRIKL